MLSESWETCSVSYNRTKTSTYKMECTFIWFTLTCHGVESSLVRESIMYSNCPSFSIPKKASYEFKIRICCVFPARFGKTWLAKNNLTETLFVRNVCGKESWPRSYIRRLMFQRVSLAFQRTRSFSKSSTITSSWPIR